MIFFSRIIIIFIAVECVQHLTVIILNSPNWASPLPQPWAGLSWGTGPKIQPFPPNSCQSDFSGSSSLLAVSAELFLLKYSSEWPKNAFQALHKAWLCSTSIFMKYNT